MRRMQTHFLRTTAIRSYLTHNKLTNTMARAGYPENLGVCHGLSCTAAQYFLLQEMQTFDDHLKFLARHSTRTDSQPKHIYDFLDRIQIAQDPDDYQLLSGRSHKPFQNIEQALAIIETDAIAKQGGIKSVDIFTGMYSITEMTRCFKLLRGACNDFSYPSAFVLSSLRHAIMVAFDASKAQWMLVDANKLPAKYFCNDNEFAVALNKALSRPAHYTGFSTRFLTIGKHKKQAKKIVMSYQNNNEWRQLHAITKRKAAIKDADGVTWLMLACADNQLHQAELLIRQGVNINATNQRGWSAMACAVWYGHTDSVRLLLKNGAKAFNGNNDYLADATELGCYDIAKMLIRYGACVNEGSPSPMFLAAKNGDKKLIKLFAEYADIGPGRCFVKNHAGLFQGARQSSKSSDEIVSPIFRKR